MNKDIEKVLKQYVLAVKNKKSIQYLIYDQYFKTNIITKYDIKQFCDKYPAAEKYIVLR